MNQIIANTYMNENFNNNKKIKNFKIRFYIILIVSIVVIISCTWYFIRSIYIQNKNDALSKQMLNKFNIQTLYSNTSNYSAQSLSSTNFIIGSIEIEALGINYPILNECTDENLKISPCKFYGPNPNENGNLCIVGHNYMNDKIFSKLNILNIGDKINIYDSYGNKIVYTIYDKYLSSSDDLKSLEQNYTLKEITLITCNKPDNSKRLIIKAKE